MPPGDRSPRLCLVISYSLWTALQGRADFELLGERTGFSFAAVESNGSRLFIAVRSSSVTYPHTLNYPALAWELHQAGCTHVLSAGVAGALDRDTPVPSLLIPDQFIDLHRTAPVNTPHHEDSLYKDFSVPYCPFLRSQAQAFLARRSEWPVSKAGNYVGVDGPRYETAAEARAYRSLGGDAVGMTAVRETIAYRYAGLCVATIALITRRAAGLEAAPASPASIANAGGLILDCGCFVASQMMECGCE